MKDLKRFWCTLLRRDNQALTAGFVPSGAPHAASSGLLQGARRSSSSRRVYQLARCSG